MKMRSQGVNKATLFRLAGLQEPKETNQEHTKLSDSTTELRDLDSVADSGGLGRRLGRGH